MKFEKYVARHRSSRKGKFNFQSSQGGVYQFENFNDFFTQFVYSYPKFSESRCTSLIFTPRRDLMMNMYLDFDFKSAEPVTLKDHDIAAFGESLVALLPEPHEFVITRRVSSYYKHTKRESYHSWGFHIWIFGKFSLQQCGIIRDKGIRVDLLAPLRKKYGFYNSSEDAWDKSPALRANGLYICGDRKKNVLCSPHYICYTSNLGSLPYGWQATNHKLFLDLLRKMYSFIWEPHGKEQKIASVSHKITKSQALKPPDIPEPPEEKKMPCSQFNLRLFLETTEGYVASNSEWKQLCVFWASQGMNPRETNEILWSYWSHACKPSQRYNLKISWQRSPVFGSQQGP